MHSNACREMFHFHHVCIRGGSDGFYTGYMGEDNDWSARQKIITKNKKINRVMVISFSSFVY